MGLKDRPSLTSTDQRHQYYPRLGNPTCKEERAEALVTPGVHSGELIRDPSSLTRKHTRDERLIMYHYEN